jgi:hypothetical protein
MIDLTWVIKLEPQVESSRWYVVLWMVNPPEWSKGLSKADPTRILLPNECKAREWAELVATSFELGNQPWTVDPGSM